MSKDSDSYDKNTQKFPARISSKIPVKIAMHSRNNSTGHKQSNEKLHDVSYVKPIAIKPFSNKTDNSLSGSYHSYFGLGQTPSNSSTSSSMNTQKNFLNNTNTELPFKYDEEDDSPKAKKSINQFDDFNESVTLGILNSEEYTRKLIRASRDSFIFDYEKDYKNYENNEEEDENKNNN
eukprot:jgi/Orpsp1_1/1192420/evm.model.d7180000093132.1